MDSIHQEALDRGVHPECFSAGPGGACEPCKTIVFDIFGGRYDHLPAEGLRGRIEVDLMREGRCDLD